MLGFKGGLQGLSGIPQDSTWKIRVPTPAKTSGVKLSGLAATVGASAPIRFRDRSRRLNVWTTQVVKKS